MTGHEKPSFGSIYLVIIIIFLGYIRLERFLPVMTLAMMNKNYRPAAEDRILKAFQTLDMENKGFLTQEALKKYLTGEGKAESLHI